MAFLGVPIESDTLYVPEISLDKYKAAEQWRNFGTILPIPGTTTSDYDYVEYTITSCNVYEWHETLYTESGEYIIAVHWMEDTINVDNRKTMDSIIDEGL